MPTETDKCILLKGTLLFLADQTEYAIPLVYTEAVVSLHTSDIHKVGKGLVATYLGKAISIVFLKIFSTWQKALTFIRPAYSRKTLINCIRGSTGYCNRLLRQPDGRLCRG